MKKKNFIILCFIAILLTFTIKEAVAFAYNNNTAYTVIVPLKYDFIEQINNEMFVTNKSSGGDYHDLYNFNGKVLMERLQDVSFAGNWIVAKKGGKYGVFSREIKEIIPCKYSRVIITDETHCVAIDGKEFAKPGTWYGERYRYDLTTGKIVEKLGYGAEFFYKPWGIWSWPPEKSKTGAAGLAGISIVKKAGKENKYGVEIGATYKAYNDSGQLLLDFTPFCCSKGYNYLTFGCAGRLFYGTVDDGNDCKGYVFSGMGRLIASQRRTSFEGLYGGNYICAYGIKPYILNYDGKTVIPKGVFDSYSFNSINSGTCTIVSNDPSDVIVSKNGKYGVITLVDY